MQFKKLIFNATLSLIFLGHYLYPASSPEPAKKVGLFIALPLTGSHLKTVRKTILRIQQEISKAAGDNGYELDTSLVPENKLHITLESTSNVESEKINDYLKTIKPIIKHTELIDLTKALNNAKFEILGDAKDWAVLRLPINKNHPLYLLAVSIKDHLKKAALKLGKYPEFKAHISLGRFIKHDKIKLPLATNLSWLPKLSISLPKESFVLNKISFGVREVYVDKDTKKYIFIEKPSKIFMLGTAVKQPTTTRLNNKQTTGGDFEYKKQEENTEKYGSLYPDIAFGFQERKPIVSDNNWDQVADFLPSGEETELPPREDVNEKDKKETVATIKLTVPKKLFKSGFRSRFNTLAIKAQKKDITPAELKESVRNALTDITMQLLFNEDILNQKQDGPPYKLSKNDSIVFKLLPKNLQDMLRKGRNIEFDNQIIGTTSSAENQGTQAVQ